MPVPSPFPLRPSPDAGGVHLIRHPAVAVSGICYGQSDIALAEPVDALAASLRTQLPDEFTLLASPLTRCRVLAEALGRPQLDARLMEIDFGKWELQPWNDIDRNLLDAWAANPLDFRSHGGESVRQMAGRAIAALEDALGESGEPLVIVSHGGPLRAMLGHLRGLAPAEWLALRIDYGSLHRADRHR